MRFLETFREGKIKLIILLYFSELRAPEQD